MKLIENLPTDVKVISNSYYEILKYVMEKTMEILGDNLNANEFFTRLAMNLFEYFLRIPN